MKPLLVYLLLSIGLELQVFSQGINTIWMSGYQSGGGLNFGTTLWNFNMGTPIISQQNQVMNFDALSIVIADSLNQLLFYTNGIYVANGNKQLLQNGNNFNTGWLTTSFQQYGLTLNQGSIVIPLPSEKYYIFSISAENTGMGTVHPTHLSYSLLDMQLDNGLGGLIWKDSTVIYDTLTAGFLNACKHANGRDWWVSIPQWKSGCVYQLLITPNGVSPPSLQCFSNPTNIGDGLGQAKYSPNGKYYALFDALNNFELYDFDRCTGIYSNARFLSLNDSAQCGGLEFSSNSRYLYVSTCNYVYQFDMQAPNVFTSKTKVATYDGFYSPSPPFATTIYLQELAPDGKIYINSNNSVQAMHRIEYPDSAGIACGVCQHCVSLPTFNAFTIPNHPNYFLGADSGSVCDTLQLGIKNAELRIQHEKITVFPNPVQNELQITYTLNEKAKQFEIIDVNGSTVFKKMLPQWSQMQHIDVSKLPDGMYLCRLQGSGKVASCKFVKVKQE